jgi:hypothetical protein
MVIAPGEEPGLPPVCRPPCPSLPMATVTYTMAKNASQNFEREVNYYLPY